MSDFGIGEILISDDVVATIAGIAALETPGVSAMSGGLSEGLSKRLSGKNAQLGVRVDVGQVETEIHLRIIIQYGVLIQEVSHAVQKAVKEAVELMTGLTVVAVHVKVEGMAMKEDDNEETGNRLK